MPILPGTLQHQAAWWLTMLCVHTEGAPWENSSMATGNTMESYRWAKVELPTEKGKIVQVSAGDPLTHVLEIQISHPTQSFC